MRSYIATIFVLSLLVIAGPLTAQQFKGGG